MRSKLSLASHTMFAELQNQCLDAQFDSDFDERGSFILKRVKREDFWYYQRWEDGKARQVYVGPARDADVTKRVENFREMIKPSYAQRRELVRALIAAGLPQTDTMTGRVVEALWKAGFFRLRGVMVGTTAFQCYCGMLRQKLANRSLRTADADFAQYLAISSVIDDTMPPMDEVLKRVDSTFCPIMDSMNGRHVVAFQNSSKYRVEFLTPKRGGAHRQSGPVRMPALGGVSAIPLSYLDYLLAHPVRSVLLHGAGIPVTIPDPARYAVHKLIVASQRSSDSRLKRAKDIDQAGELIVALVAEGLQMDLVQAWIEAWDRGPKWREALKIGRSALSATADNGLTLSAAMCSDDLDNFSLSSYGLSEPD